MFSLTAELDRRLFVTPLRSSPLLGRPAGCEAEVQWQLPQRGRQGKAREALPTNEPRASRSPRERKRQAGERRASPPK